MVQEKFGKVYKSLKILLPQLFLKLHFAFYKLQYFIFLQEHPRPKLTVFQYQIWNLVKHLKSNLSRKTNSSFLLQLGCSDFWLNLC